VFFCLDERKRSKPALNICGLGVIELLIEFLLHSTSVLSVVCDFADENWMKKSQNMLVWLSKIVCDFANENWMKKSQNMLVWLSKMVFGLAFFQPKNTWLDSLIDPGGLLLIVFHLFAIPSGARAGWKKKSK
jgi:hypothetical protein